MNNLLCKGVHGHGENCKNGAEYGQIPAPEDENQEKGSPRAYNVEHVSTWRLHRKCWLEPEII